MVMLRRRINFVRVILALISSLFFLTSEGFAAPDYAREQRWADEITPAIIVGDSILLTQKNQHQFLGIYAQADNASTGLVIVHGMGLHPDWGMISTLRQELFEYGYTTLSIQMPVLSADAGYELYPELFPEVVERLQIAVAFLKGEGYKRIAIVSHSNGSRMSRVYMARNPKDVNAWVALSLTQGDSFEGVNVPVLDLYGEKDLPHVLSATDKRQASLDGNVLSKQKVIADADHFFAGYEDKMVEVVRGFLDGLK